MRILVTGLRGTVGRALHARLGRDGHDVVPWNRAEVPIDRYDAMDRFIARAAPDAIINLAIASKPTGRPNESWLVNHDWPSELAWSSRQHEVRFLHVSTVMVFSPAAIGPFTVDATPDAPEGYGYEKRMAEARVFHQNPKATVVRLGWQIGEAPGSNNMLDFFDRQIRERGHVAASSKWRPACSFLPDTVDALVRALAAPPGLYQIDANTDHTFFAIASALSAQHGNRWKIVASGELEQDQRMIDPRLDVAPLRSRLPTLA